MKILFLTQTPAQGPASRYRVYQYLEYLKERGVEYTVSPSISAKAYRKFYKQDTLLKNICFLGIIFLNRLRTISKARKYDLVFLQREFIPYFPVWLEKLLYYFNQNIIFDFDDAIFLPPCHKKWIYKFGGTHKIAKIIGFSKHVIVGNEYLKEYALRYNSRVTLIPTAVDTARYSIKLSRSIKKEIVIGWIGMPSNIPYLRQLEKVFEILSRKYNITLKIISTGKIKFKNVKIVVKEWKYEEENSDLQSLDIGVMPLIKDDWSKGKCGTKILQYMAAGVPSVASPVGANKEIIQDGINGFLADSEEEWMEKLSLLSKYPKLRYEIGANGRKTVENFYSLKVNAPKLTAALEGVYLGG